MQTFTHSKVKDLGYEFRTFIMRNRNQRSITIPVIVKSVMQEKNLIFFPDFFSLSQLVGHKQYNLATGRDPKSIKNVFPLLNYKAMIIIIKSDYLCQVIILNNNNKLQIIYTAESCKILFKAGIH